MNLPADRDNPCPCWSLIRGRVAWPAVELWADWIIRLRRTGLYILAGIRRADRAACAPAGDASRTRRDRKCSSRPFCGFCLWGFVSSRAYAMVFFFVGRVGCSFLIETQAQNSTGEQHYSGFCLCFLQARRIWKTRDCVASSGYRWTNDFEATAKRGLLAFGFSSSSEVFSLFVDFWIDARARGQVWWESHWPTVVETIAHEGKIGLNLNGDFGG